ncbi:lactonase family protein [Terriglobus aquaticus]|uniref:Lactonase family protein n=2 Tax=Terriglobus aquaticus TaxID=940139 RepID=A0ABW9KJ10_9BACT
MSNVESAAATAQQSSKRAPGTVRLLIGTSKRDSKGLYTAYFSNGTLSAPALAEPARNPSFLALPRPDYPVLFAVTQPEDLPSHASSFTHPPMSDRPDGDQFQKISDAPSHGKGGCHVGVSPDGHSVFIANYAGASVASFHADDRGALTLASHIDFPPDGHGPNPDRQQQSYIHSALSSPDGNFVLVNDLGLDRIHIFRLDHATAKLTPHGEWHAEPGSGPRHLALHPNGHWIYCIHELNSTVVLLHWNAAEGTLTTAGQPISTLPPGVDAAGKRASELAFSHDLRFLYASNRVHESFTVYSIDPQTGALSTVQHLENPGKESRHIALSPDGKFFLSANQFSDEISVFPIDTATGKLGDRTSTVPIAGPSCLLFA